MALRTLRRFRRHRRPTITAPPSRIEHGVAALATVLRRRRPDGASSPGTTYQLELVVFMPGRQRFNARIEQYLDATNVDLVMPGRTLPVRVDRDNPHHIRLDWSRLATAS